MKDSLDGKFDLSRYIIESNGFVPVPVLVTEPALGGFGGGLVPVFIKKRPPYVDVAKGEEKITNVPPDITGVAGIYTANKTWTIALFRSGTFIRPRIRYIAGGGYANVNLSFYRKLPLLGEKEFRFNGKVIPIMLQATKRIGRSNWYLGMRYQFLKTDLTYTGDPLLPPAFVKTHEYNSVISLAGVLLELDTRDNVFTPDKGMKLHFDGALSDDALGSDFDYGRLDYYLYAYKPLGRSFVAGLRLDGQQALGDPPFFLLPFIDMRGVPAARYQGKADVLGEAEIRWDPVRRWSLVAFGGAAKAFDDWKEFGEAGWTASGGAGFRYLLARQFKLRIGVDVARGPDTWAYYIVFGSNWMK